MKGRIGLPRSQLENLIPNRYYLACNLRQPISHSIPLFTRKASQATMLLKAPRCQITLIQVASKRQRTTLCLSTNCRLGRLYRLPFPLPHPCDLYDHGYGAEEPSRPCVGTRRINKLFSCGKKAPHSHGCHLHTGYGL